MDKDGSAIRPSDPVDEESEPNQKPARKQDASANRPAGNTDAEIADPAGEPALPFASRRAEMDAPKPKKPQKNKGKPQKASQPQANPPKPNPKPTPAEQATQGPAQNNRAKAPGPPNPVKPAQKPKPVTANPAKGPATPAQANPNQQQQQPPAQIKPLAQQAQMRRRHWGLLLSLLVVVIVPFVAVVCYLFLVAQPQYHSLTGFTVRSQEESGANDLLGGLAQLTGGATASDNDILYEFIRSQEMVEAVNERVDLREHYSQHWPNDWFFSVWDDATKEDLIWFWNRKVGVSYDQSTGLIEVQLTAFDPATAQALTQAIVDVSHERINALNLAARNEAMQYAMTDLEESLERLKSARQALTTYRIASQIVDPQLDIQTRMGVMSSLQQELANALVEYDLLIGTTSAGDPRLRDATQRIDVIRDRIAIERQNLASSSTETGGVEEDYPTLIAEFERLTTDREFAEEVYFASLQAVEIARDEANRSSRFLATYINPTQADTSEYPRAYVLSGLSLLFLVLTWSIGSLIYYSIRDRS